MLLEPDQLLDGKYRIVRLLGQGGMGAVYEGHHELIDRRIAIKTLLPSIQEEASVVRFEREARAAGRIGNDHILEIYDIGSLADGGRYMVMEYLDGETLSDRIRKRQRLHPAEVVHIALQLLNGLGAAHGAGVLHRDLKPDNIFLVGTKAGIRDFVKIIDFGISKFNLGKDEMRMTATGMVVGTPYYIAPEVAKGLGDVDHRADLYAVGVILYEALAGRVPFDADNFNNLLFKIVLEEAPRLTTLVPDLDPALADLVHRAMAREKNDRFQTCAELAEALQTWAAAAGITLGGFETTTGIGRPSQASVAGIAGMPTGEQQTFAGAAAAPHVSLQHSAPHFTPGPSTIQAPAVRAATPGAFGASQAVEVQRSKRPLGLILGASAAVVALAAVMVVALSGGGEDETGAAASATAADAQDPAVLGPDDATPTEPAPPADTAKPAADTPSTAAKDEPADGPEPADKPAKAADAAPDKPDPSPQPTSDATASRRPTGDTSAASTTTRRAPTTTRAPAPRPSPAPEPTTTERSRRNFGY